MRALSVSLKYLIIESLIKGVIMQPIRQSRFEQICEKVVHIGFGIMMVSITLCAIAIVYSIIVK